ncbi:hypothetical protein SAMN06297144_1659 [Sphingomonas guangdongensis]|uniref:Uncharacterized protein n=1 Tax=Sphingomonas guangdongensis TaxID=1141890 RepID=A0A285QXA6_9SPHN|nr:hypothetical protein SAMN06297144_1659 [Sphingomonas guangdongensis]
MSDAPGLDSGTYHMGTGDFEMASLVLSEPAAKARLQSAMFV